MQAREKRLVGMGLLLGLSLISVGRGFARPAIKVRVTVDNAIVKATPAIGGLNVATLPLDSVLIAEGKQGDWYKVLLTREGIQVSGYIHMLLVKEISENEAQQSLIPPGRAKAQADIVADIERRIENDKKLLRQENEPDKVLDDLTPLIPRAFTIDDRLDQKRIACQLYFWIGMACSNKGDLGAALKNFKAMLDVDYALGQETTRNIAEPSISNLLDQADRLYKGLLVDYGLQITTKPKEAELKINGKSIGLSPLIYRSSTPQISLEVEKEGYRTIKEDLFLSQATTIKDYALVNIGRNLAVASLPKGARVFIDGKDTGKTTDGMLPFVPYGSHTIKLVLQNYAVWEAPLEILEGEGPATLAATLTVNTYIFAQKNGGPELKFFKMPRAIAFDKEGNFYIVDESDVKIKKFNREGRFLAAWGDAGREARSLKMPAGIAVDTSGGIYVTDARACCVMKFDQTGRFQKKWGAEGSNPDELAAPAGIAIDAAGDLYVADTNNNRIVKFSPDGAVKKIWGKQGIKPGEFVFPSGVTIGRKNEVIVVDRARVQRFTPVGDPVGAWGKTGSGDGEMKVPQGVFADAFDSIYIADTGNNRILKFDPSGKLVSQWGGPGAGDGQMMSPVAVAVSGNGNVYIVEKDNHRYQEFRIPEK